MKKVIALIIILVSCTSIIVSCVARKSEPLSGRPFKAKNSKIAHGEQLYMIHCQKCHPSGEAGLGPSLNRNPAPGFLKRFQMRHGLGVMPAFSKGELSHSDLKDISKYIHAWKAY